MKNKLARLEMMLRNFGSVLVAYSGGVDSTFLAAVAHASLGDRMMAVTALSPTYPSHQIDETRSLAQKLSFHHMFIETGELDDPSFVNNDTNRCYYCKRGLFAKLRQVAEEKGLAQVIDGANRDDLGDYRPGRKAAVEGGVRSPLCDCDMSKEEIRALSYQWGLPTWDRPSSACLASRFPYGTAITRELLRRVAQAEEFLGGLGIRQVRVRHYGDTARIEVEPEGIRHLLEDSTRVEIVKYLRSLGYIYITLDLSGYRSGSMNEAFMGRDIEDSLP